MVQTFQGYFKEGRFISHQTEEIPEFVEVYIVVTSKPIPLAYSGVKQKNQEIENFVRFDPITEPRKTAKQKMSTEEALIFTKPFQGLR